MSVESFFLVRVFIDESSILCSGLPDVEFLTVNHMCMLLFESESARITLDVNFPRVQVSAYGSAVLGYNHFFLPEPRSIHSFVFMKGKNTSSNGFLIAMIIASEPSSFVGWFWGLTRELIVFIFTPE